MMPGLSSILKMLQYSPILLELFRAVMPMMPEGRKAEEARDEMHQFQQEIAARITELQEENVRLRGRLRDLESLVSTLQLFVWIGGGALFLLFIITLVVALARG